MVEKLVVDEDANATSSQQSIFKIGTKKIIVQGDIMDSGSDINSLQQNFFKILDKSVALPGDGDGTRTLSSAGSNDYFYLAKDQQPTHYTPESDIAIPIPPVPAWDNIIAHPTLSNNLVRYYKLDGNANDSLGIQNGNISGAIPSQDGKINTSYQFSGKNYIYIGNPVTNTFTVSVWFKIYQFPSSTSRQITTLGGNNSTPSSTNYYYLTTTNTNILVYGNHKGGINTNTLQINKWYHAVIINTTSFAKFYLDGVLQGNLAGQTAYSNGHCGIGSLRSQDDTINGVVDEYALWNRALTEQEISDLYNSGNGLKYD